jgi:trans-o-hydroxybenzylidenepyruvate hydratase-aldolase
VATLRTATSGRINFLPSDMVAQEFAALDPGATTALWATAASMGPWPCKALIDAISQRDAAAVKRIAADIAWSNEPIETILADQSVFASYNIQVEKVRIDTAGYCKAGPVRPPYDAMPDEFVAASVECGERWREMCDRYRSPILP